MQKSFWDGTEGLLWMKGTRIRHGSHPLLLGANCLELSLSCQQILDAFLKGTCCFVSAGSQGAFVDVCVTQIQEKESVNHSRQSPAGPLKSIPKKELSGKAAGYMTT